MRMFICRLLYILHWNDIRFGTLHREASPESQAVDRAQVTLERFDETAVSARGIGAAIHLASDEGKRSATLAGIRGAKASAETATELRRNQECVAGCVKGRAIRRDARAK